ncbi:MAG: glycosyltransferase family 2 protein [Myxococcota bacterium]|jgi:hypothetical protein|nr:glycosyltransferase family 2 protein [Myxococcota bacterium]
MDLSVVVLSYETKDLLLDCVESIEKALEGPALRGASEIIVVDNGSRDGSAEAIRERHPRVEVIALEDNRGFAGGNNVAIERAGGRYIALVNSDVVVEPDTFERVLEVFETRKDVGAAGVQLLHPDGRLQNSIHVFPSLWREVVPTWLLETLAPRRFPSKRRPPAEPIEVESVLGAVFVVRREVVDDVGPLCDDYFFFLEETDWCWRMAERGWKVLHLPNVRVVHASGASSKQKDAAATRIEYSRSLDRFLRAHRGAFEAEMVRVVRVTRHLLALLPLTLAGLFSARHRARLSSVMRLLRWHAAGRPAQWGLSGTRPKGFSTGC